MIVLYSIIIVLDFFTIVFLPFLFAFHSPRNRYPKKRYYIAGIAVFTAAVFFVTWAHDDIITMPVLLAVYILVCQHLFNRGKIALFYQAIYLIILFILQFAFIVIARIIFDYTHLDLITISCIAVIMKIISECIYTLIMIQIVKIRRMSEISKKQLAWLFMIPLYSLFNVLVMFIIGQVFYLRYGYTLLIVNIIFLLAVNFYCLYLYYDFSKSQELKRQLEFDRRQNELAYRYYSAMDARLLNTRKVIHDIHNHMTAIEQLYLSGDIKDGNKYIKDVHELIDSLGLQYYTDNRMLNMILNDKLARTAACGVRTEVHLYHLKLEFMKDIDITTVFSNLLDNAIDAAAESKERFIEIKSAGFNDMLTIHIKNSVSKAVKTDSEMLHSTKRGHAGLGLGNVERTVQNYHGTLSLSCKDNLFCASLLFPLKEVSDNAQA